MNVALLLTGVTGLVVLVVILLAVIANRYYTAGPHEALIISGRRPKRSDDEQCRYRIFSGGPTFGWPEIERSDRVSLDNIILDIVTPEFYTRLGVPIRVEAVAQIKVRGDEVSIGTAAEQFLSKS